MLRVLTRLTRWSTCLARVSADEFEAEGEDACLFCSHWRVRPCDAQASVVGALEMKELERTMRVVNALLSRTPPPPGAWVDKRPDARLYVACNPRIRLFGGSWIDVKSVKLPSIEIMNSAVFFL